jgi:hypothetical protein
MQVWLIGVGNMARAMARGWGDPVLASDSGSGWARALAGEFAASARGKPVALVLAGIGERLMPAATAVMGGGPR